MPNCKTERVGHVMFSPWLGLVWEGVNERAVRRPPTEMRARAGPRPKAIEISHYGKMNMFDESRVSARCGARGPEPLRENALSYVFVVSVCTTLRLSTSLPYKSAV